MSSVLEDNPRNINDQTFEVNSIENLTSEHEKSMKIEIEAKFDLESEDFNLRPDRRFGSGLGVKPKCTSS